ncbi:hypothetical protein C8R45DRAFT_420286 [Mycena sanguinolenta]|nr:hypothetical protein C8R45DRAFT_420286 [Mycena sanguinolenta]
MELLLPLPLLHRLYFYLRASVATDHALCAPRSSAAQRNALQHLHIRVRAAVFIRISRSPAAVDCDMPLGTSFPPESASNVILPRVPGIKPELARVFAITSFLCLMSTFLSLPNYPLSRSSLTASPTLLSYRDYCASYVENAVLATCCDSPRTQVVPSPVWHCFTSISHPARRLLSSHWRDRRGKYLKIIYGVDGGQIPAVSWWRNETGISTSRRASPRFHIHVHPQLRSSSPPLDSASTVQTCTPAELSRRKKMHVQLVEDVSLWVYLRLGGTCTQTPRFEYYTTSFRFAAQSPLITAALRKFLTPVSLTSLFAEAR